MRNSRQLLVKLRHNRRRVPASKVISKRRVPTMSGTITWMVSLGRHGFLVSVIVLLFLEWMTDGNLATGWWWMTLVGVMWTWWARRK